MLGFFDSHAHYNDKKFDEDRDILLNRLFNENIVSYIMNVGYDLKSSYDTIDLCDKYPFVYGAVGIHPHDSKDADNSTYDLIREMAKNNKIRAIGETGLDYYYDNSEREIQKREFANHLDLATELSLPVIIHQRDAISDCLDIIKTRENIGVFHCFSGSVETAKILLDKGYYISIAGPVTFKNSRHAKEVSAYVPADRLLIETDCPYLAPEPYRGQRNSSEYLRQIAEEIAKLRNTTVEDIVKITKDNAMRLFKI